MGRHSTHRRVLPWLLFGVLPVAAIAVMIAVITFARSPAKHDDAGPIGPTSAPRSTLSTVSLVPVSPAGSTTGCGTIVCSSGTASSAPAPGTTPRSPTPTPVRTTPSRTPTTPVSSPPVSSSSPVLVVLGDRCSVAGAHATARNGKPAVCKRGDDGQLRWRRPS